MNKNVGAQVTVRRRVEHQHGDAFFCACRRMTMLSGSTD
jgi:hypothetical protein